MTTKYIVDVDDKNQIVGTPVLYTEKESNSIAQDGSFAPSPFLITLGVVFIVIVILVFLSFFRVKQQTVKIIERFGKFKKTVSSGLNFKIPFIDRIAGEISLQTEQRSIRAETKTKDNVFVSLIVAVQYTVIPEKVYDAFYKLSDHRTQIDSYVLNTIRSKVPTLSLDDVFTNKEEISLAVQTELAKDMTDYGYKILTVLVVDISPDEKVKESMNEIQTQQRLQIAATAKGEAEKVLVIKRAEAQSEAKRLQGEGIAAERKAIVAGLEMSVKSMKDDLGVSSQEVMSILMMTQYFDTIKDSNATKMILMPHSPAGVTDIKNQITQAMLIADEAK